MVYAADGSDIIKGILTQSTSGIFEVASGAMGELSCFKECDVARIATGTMSPVVYIERKPEIPLPPEPSVIPESQSAYEIFHKLLESFAHQGVGAQVYVEDVELAEYGKLSHVSYSVFRAGNISFSSHEVCDMLVQMIDGYVALSIRVY
jgi:hypothetical protein